MIISYSLIQDCHESLRYVVGPWLIGGANTAGISASMLDINAGFSNTGWPASAQHLGIFWLQQLWVWSPTEQYVAVFSHSYVNGVNDGHHDHWWADGQPCCFILCNLVLFAKFTSSAQIKQWCLFNKGGYNFGQSREILIEDIVSLQKSLLTGCPVMKSVHESQVHYHPRVMMMLIACNMKAVPHPANFLSWLQGHLTWVAMHHNPFTVPKLPLLTQDDMIFLITKTSVTTQKKITYLLSRSI